MTPSHKNQCCDLCTGTYRLHGRNKKGLCLDRFCPCHSPEKEVKTSGYSAPDWSTFKPVSASQEESWEKELRRQCDIRHLPYQDVRYLVSELRSQAIQEDRAETFAAISDMTFRDILPDERVGTYHDRKRAYQHALRDIRQLLTKEDNE